MDFIFDAALDQWHDWETTPAQWLLLNGSYPPDRVGQVWVSDVAPYEVAVANYQRQPVTGPIRIVDNSQHVITYDCENPDFGTIAADPPGISKLCLAKVGTDDSDSLLLATYDLTFYETGPLQPVVAPSGVYWVSPMEPDTYTLTFQAPPEGVTAGTRSAWLNVPAATEITTITWQDLPDGVVNVYNEAFGTGVWTTLYTPPASGTRDLDPGTLMLDVPTRLSIGPTMDMGPDAKVELTLLGSAGSQTTPPDEEWLPPGPRTYTMYASANEWEHYDATWGDVGRSNECARFSVPSEAWVNGITIHIDGPASSMELTAKLAYVDGSGQTFNCSSPGTSLSWNFSPVRMVPNPDGTDIPGHGGSVIQVNVWETGASITGGDPTPSLTTSLRAEVHLTNASAGLPDGWRGSASNPAGWQDEPINA